MQIVKEIDGFWELQNNSWGGALDTLEKIEIANKEDEFMDYIESFFEGEKVNETELNDFIWFDSDMIFRELGLDENGDIPNEDEEEEEEEE